MKGIPYAYKVFWSILVLVSLTCNGQQQGRPYFQNQQHPQDVPNGVPRDASEYKFWACFFF